MSVACAVETSTVAEESARRLAAVLAADLVGYNRMMERDEAGTLRRLKTIRHAGVRRETGRRR